MNLSTIVVFVVVCLVVGRVVYAMIQDRKNGKSSCGGNCGGCASSNLCHDPKAFFNQIKEQEFTK